MTRSSTFASALLTIVLGALAACGGDDGGDTSATAPVVATDAAAVDTAAAAVESSTAASDGTARPRPSLPGRTTPDDTDAPDGTTPDGTEAPDGTTATSPPATDPATTAAPGTSAAPDPATTSTTAPGTPGAGTRPTRTVPGSVPTSGVGSLPADPRAGYAEGDPGTVTVALSEPVAIAGWAAVPVSCSVTALTYTASFSGAAVTAGVSVSATITAAPYRGPGTYPGAGTLSVTLADGQDVTVPLAAQVDVADDLAGSVHLDVTSTSGVQVAGSLVWHCSP